MALSPQAWLRRLRREPGRPGKGNFYEPVIRVPLVVSPPRRPSAHRTFGGLVEVYDVAPTVLDLREDPLERRDLAGEARYRDEIDRHRRLLIDRLMRLA